MITLRPLSPPQPRRPFAQQVLDSGGRPLTAIAVETLQVNLGYRCNLSCSHCHVEAGPGRQEVMDGATIDEVLRVLAAHPVPLVDITGGAPELNPHFRRLVASARGLGKRVLVRTNLAIFHEPAVSGLPAFYRQHGAELVASLPCYRENNVDAMRGRGVFSRCIASLRELNALGYGQPDGLPLHLVYNPGGPFLPPQQNRLEQEYRRALRDGHGISFTSLYALANMPIGRFREGLARTNDLDRYQDLLSGAFNPATLAGIMCRTLLSVGWDGRLYDCDFNQVLGLVVEPEAHRHIRDFSYERLAGRAIRVGDHCYGCTAGHGSTCTGATA